MDSGSERFGAFLRDLRQARRLTLEDVQRGTLDEPEPVTRSLLSRLENGKARISALKLMALARLYGVRVGLLAERLELELQLDGGGPGPADAGGDDALAERAREACREGRLREAMRLVRAARGCGSTSVPRARLELARLLAEEGRMHSALTLLQEIDAEPLEAADRARACYLLSRAALDAGRTLLARGAFLALHELPTPWPSEIAAGSALLRAELVEADGRTDEALEAWLTALDGAREARCAALEGTCLVRLAALERRRGSARRALSWCRKALALSTRAGDDRLRVEALTEKGRAQRARGCPERARQAWCEARELARSGEHHDALFAVYAELWRLARSERDAVAARACLRALRHLARLVDALPRDAGDVVDALAPAAAAGASAPRAGSGPA